MKRLNSTIFKKDKSNKKSAVKARMFVIKNTAEENEITGFFFIIEETKE